MPELPDLEVYLDCLRPRVLGQVVQGARLLKPFLLRTVTPPLQAVVGRTVTSVSRLGKRVVLHLDGDLFLVVHLMIAGRLHWQVPKYARLPKLPSHALLALDFPQGTLVLTEAGSKRRASLHVLHGHEALIAQDPGGLEPLRIDAATFAQVLRRQNHTLKRALTDPRLLAGIGNAYSDEILHRARLSPLVTTARLDDATLVRLHDATVATLTEWTQRLREQAGDGFPEKVTAFREDMAVHGKFGQPCPTCGSPVQRIVYADNETNYCAICQTEGRLLADRALSRLLHDDWPKNLGEA